MRLRLLTVAALVLFPASALAVPSSGPLPSGFVPFSSLGGIRMGMFEKTVRADLGPANSVNLGNGHGVTQLLYARNPPNQSLIISFDPHRSGDPVARMQASGAGFHTPGGVGTASTLSAVRSTFPTLKCQGISCTGHRGTISMVIDFYHGHVSLINLADTRFTGL